MVAVQWYKFSSPVATEMPGRGEEESSASSCSTTGGRGRQRELHALTSPFQGPASSRAPTFVILFELAIIACHLLRSTTLPDSSEETMCGDSY